MFVVSLKVRTFAPKIIETENFNFSVLQFFNSKKMKSLFNAYYYFYFYFGNE